MFKKILSFISLSGFFIPLFLPVSANAALFSYYGEQGQALPSIQDRVKIASECNIEAYRGTAEQNMRLEDCLRKVDYWVARIKTNDINPLSDEDIASVPERAWKLVTPQVIQVVRVDENFLGGSEPSVIKQFTCIGDECDKYVKNEAVGFSVVSRYKTTLQSSMTSSQTTVPVSSISTFDGHTLTMSDLGSAVYLTVEPGSSREEITKCTGIASSIWNPCTRGLAFYGTSESSVSANQHAHNAGSIVVMSNVHYVYDQLVDRDSNETASGTKKFASNELIVGDGTTTSDKRFYFCDSLTTSTCGFLFATPSTTSPGTQTLGYSPDGSTQYSFDAGSSGLLASSTRAIGITNSRIHVNASSTGGLEFDRESTGGTGFIQVKASSTAGIGTDANGTYIKKGSFSRFDSTGAFQPDAATTSAANKIVAASSTAQIDKSWLALTTSGDMAYYNGNLFARIPIGSSNNILAVSSTTGFPTWVKAVDVVITSTPVGFTGTKTFAHTLGQVPGRIEFELNAQTDNGASAEPALSWGSGVATSTVASANNSIACFMQGGTATGKNCVVKKGAIELYTGGGNVAFSFTVSAWDNATYTLNITTNLSASINDFRNMIMKVYPN